jgi:hypothetical protein
MFLILLSANVGLSVAQDIGDDSLKQGEKEVEVKRKQLSDPELPQTHTDDLNGLPDTTDFAILEFNSSKGRLQSEIDSLRSRLDSLELTEGNMDSLELHGAGVIGKSQALRQEGLQLLCDERFESNSIGEVGGIAGKLHRMPEMNQLSLPKIQAPNSLWSEEYLQEYASQLHERIGRFGSITGADGSIPNQLRIPATAIPEQYQQYGDMIDDPSVIDGFIERQAGETEVSKALSQNTNALPGQDDLPVDMLNDLERFTDMSNMRSTDKRQVMDQAKELAVDHAQKVIEKHGKQLNSAMGELARLKKKYSAVPDSRDLSTAVKRNSLKGKPFKERLMPGGNFQILRGNPVSLDMSPYLLYRVNKAFFAGVGATYRAGLGIDNNQQTNIAQDVYGLNAIVQHKIYKGFFGHVEGVYMNRPIIGAQNTSDVVQRSWSEGLMLGIGKRMRLSHFLAGTIILTYDFLHNDRSVHPKPWNVRFGFELEKMSLSKRRALVKSSK